MWKEPKLHEIDAPKEYLELINKSVFFNRTGYFENASRSEVFQYAIALFFSWIFLSSITSLLVHQVVLLTNIGSLQAFVFSFILIIFTGFFYYFGWKKYDQAWYHFDEKNEMFIVTRKKNGDWETIEIPFEQISRVEWVGGSNGFAKIRVPGFSFDTNRASTQRFSSVTELWDNLARFDTTMTNWPIELTCENCDRSFGHHIGTATCPFDNLILVDRGNKGRIDPEEMHPDDYDRI